MKRRIKEGKKEKKNESSDTDFDIAETIGSLSLSGTSF